MIYLRPCSRVELASQVSIPKKKYVVPARRLASRNTGMTKMLHAIQCQRPHQISKVDMISCIMSGKAPRKKSASKRKPETSPHLNSPRGKGKETRVMPWGPSAPGSSVHTVSERECTDLCPAVSNSTLYKQLPGVSLPSCVRSKRGKETFKKQTKSSHHGAAETNLTSIHEDAGSISGLTQWVKDLVLP